MTTPVILAVVWILAASVIAFLPSKVHKPSAMYLLVPTALALIPWIYVENGLLVALLFLYSFGSILRWPVYFLGKFVIGQTKRVLRR